jgi:hypothetical protein
MYPYSSNSGNGIESVYSRRGTDYFAYSKRSSTPFRLSCPFAPAETSRFPAVDGAAAVNRLFTIIFIQPRRKC